MYEDLFKPRKRFKAFYEYHGEGKIHELHLVSPDRDSAHKEFLDIMNNRKWRKVKKYDIHQETWGW